MGDIVNLDDMIRKEMGKYAGNGISKSSQQKDRPAKAMLDYARFLDAKAEYVENAACITEDAALKALNLAGIDPEGFYVDEESVDDYLDGVEDEEFFDNPIVYSCDKGDTYYYVEVYMNLTPDEDEKDLAVNSSIYKIDGCTTSIFDFESKSWDALPSAESPKKSFEVSGTEEDILNVLLCMTEGTLSKKKYDSIKRKHTSLFELYDQTCKYMEPAGFFDKSRKKSLLFCFPKILIVQVFLFTWTEKNLYCIKRLSHMTYQMIRRFIKKRLREQPISVKSKAVYTVWQTDTQMILS